MAKLRSDLSLAKNGVKVFADGTTLRAFLSYMIRRHDGSKRQVPELSYPADDMGKV